MITEGGFPEESENQTEEQLTAIEDAETKRVKSELSKLDNETKHFINMGLWQPVEVSFKQSWKDNFLRDF